MNVDWVRAHAAIWRANRQILKPVLDLDNTQLDQLIGIDRQKRAVIENTERFLNGKPANNVLMWGARGTGKSSVVKALLNAYAARGLRVIQIEKEDLGDLALIVDELRESPFKFMVYCDDMSFEPGDYSYKGLKTVLEGSIERPPSNMIIVATSNRRHLVPEYMHENDLSRVDHTEVHHADSVEEKLALSDRFGLCLSFYAISQDDYFAIIDQLFGKVDDQENLHVLAARYAISKGGRSGRTAEQFYKTHSDQF